VWLLNLKLFTFNHINNKLIQQYAAIGSVELKHAAKSCKKDNQIYSKFKPQTNQPPHHSFIHYLFFVLLPT